MKSVVLQVCLAIAMFVTTSVAGLLPYKVLRVISKKEKDDKPKNILTLLSCFAGGVFLGTCFLDIIPHVKSNYQRLLVTAGWNVTYPFPEFCTCFGFFLVYAIEEITLRIFSEGHHHSHGPGGGHSNNGTVGPSHVESGADEIEPLKASCDTSTTPDGSTDTYMVVQTHEKVMDETVNYMSSTSTAQGGVLKSITFAVAMSFHSILEGIALGVQDNSTGIITLFISLMIHKGVEAFSVGLQISRSNSQRFRIVLITVTIYALMTPMGSMIGVIIQNLDINEVVREATIVVLEGMAAGTFIYVTFFEVLAQERANDYSNLKQLYAIVTGFLVIATLLIYEHFIQG
uniref:Zinc transporter ZIP3 n=1 Tax=Steinernema glaseri TaxID=37863 RepID=A0A1I7ZBK8_9BILA